MCEVFCRFADAEIHSASGAGALDMFHLIRYIMAIINSLAIGKSVKSAGNLTYKTVRGRTIASQRITTNKSNTPLQQAQRLSFTNLSQSMQFYQSWIDRCYEKSKFGSSRNNFAKTNPKFNAGNILGEIKEGIASAIEGIVASYALPSGANTRALSQFSKGSLPCIVSEETEVITSLSVGGAYTNVLSCKSINIQFTAPVTVDKVKLFVMYSGPSDNNFAYEFAQITEDGTVTLPTLFKTEITECAFTVVNGLVTAFKIVYSGSQTFGQVCPILDGKVPNIRSFHMVEL